LFTKQPLPSTDEPGDFEKLFEELYALAAALAAERIHISAKMVQQHLSPEENL
jgi:hypothetical protein